MMLYMLIDTKIILYLSIAYEKKKMKDWKKYTAGEINQR